MKAAVKIDEVQVQEMDLTISLTMSVSGWRQLMAAAPASYPSWKFAACVAKALVLVSQATDSTFEVEP
jgi:hypothetical protein